MKEIQLPSLTPFQVAFDLEDGRFVLVEIIPTLIEGLKDTFLLQGKAWQINADGTRFTDERGGAVMLPTKTRTVTVEPGPYDLHNQMADAAAAILEQFKLHAQLREAYARKALLPEPDKKQDEF